MNFRYRQNKLLSYVINLVTIYQKTWLWCGSESEISDFFYIRYYFYLTTWVLIFIGTELVDLYDVRKSYNTDTNTTNPA